MSIDEGCDLLTCLSWRIYNLYMLHNKLCLCCVLCQWTDSLWSVKFTALMGQLWTHHALHVLEKAHKWTPLPKEEEHVTCIYIYAKGWGGGGGGGNRTRPHDHQCFLHGRRLVCTFSESWRASSMKRLQTALYPVLSCYVCDHAALLRISTNADFSVPLSIR